MRYSDLVAVAPRFSRAVNLERDAHVPASIEGYIVTSTAADVIARLGRALSAPAGHRAWTLTGPYGSGKSAFSGDAAYYRDTRRHTGDCDLCWNGARLRGADADGHTGAGHDWGSSFAGPSGHVWQ